MFADAGYTSVNWNLGCPYPMVTKRMQGAGLLPHPQRIVAILEAAFPRIAVNLSIKTRLGLNSPAELQALLPGLAPFNINEIIIHGRTAAQMYDGEVLTGAMQAVLPYCTAPVVVNGDITTLAAFEKMQAAFPDVSRFMIGRGLLCDPFLTQRIRMTALPSDDVRRQRLRDFHDELFEDYQDRLSGDAHLLQKMIPHWVYFAEWFEGSVQGAVHFRKVKSVAQYRAMVMHLFDSFNLRV